MSVNIITYTGRTRTAQHDAMTYDAAIGQSGILYGCEVTASGNVLTIANGYGIIKGRVFEVQQEDFNVQLAPSGTLYGFLNLTLDLSNSEAPLSMAVTTSTTNSNTLTKDEDTNFDGGIYQMELATFTVSTAEVSNVQRVARTIHGGVKIITETDWSLDELIDDGWYYFDHHHTPVNSPGTVANGWAHVVGGVGAIKQMIWREGSENTQFDVFVRSFTSSAWTSFRRLVSENEMYYMPGYQTGLRINCGGYITSGGTYINGFIPLPKPVHSSVTGVTVVSNTNYKITIRQNGKYLVNEVNTASLGTTCVVRANGLDLNLNKAAGFGGTNNDTVSIVGYILVRFT